MTRLFGTNGIRGVANDDLSASFVCELAHCMTGVFSPGSVLIIGSDSRQSSEMLKMAAMAGLNNVGIHVIDVGYAPTPAIQFAVKTLQADGGLIITASHNPPCFNGLKVIARDGIELAREDEERIEHVYDTKTYHPVPWEDMGHITKRTIIEPYVNAILSHVNVDQIRKRNFTVVVDPGNGVGGLSTPMLLRELGCKVITLNGHLDGTFPARFPEPTPETLKQLGDFVQQIHADFAVAHDGDADRAIFVDDKGRVVWGDQTFALIAREVLGTSKQRSVVTPVSSGKIIQDVVEASKGELVWTRVGAIIVSRKLVEINGALGGEENGGIFYPPHQCVRDGGMTTALIAQILADRNKSLSALVESLPKYYIKKDGVPCEHEAKEQLLGYLLEQTKDAHRMTLDGIKLLYPDGSILLRPSGTEPKFRCYSEAVSEEKALVYLNYGIELLKKGVKETSKPRL